MHVKSFGTRLIGLILFGVSCFYAARWLHLQTILAADRKPYTVLYEESFYWTNPDGSIKAPIERKGGVYLKARRGDGSTVKITLDPAAWHNNGKPVFQVREILSVPEALHVLTYDTAPAKSTTRVTTSELAAAKALPGDPSCMSEIKDLVGQSTVLGRGTHLGLEVVKRRLPSSPGSAVVELWQAPALDCEAVYGQTLFPDKNGAFTDTSIRKAIRVDLTEPDPSLFATGPGREVSPSEALLAFINKSQNPPLPQLPAPLAGKMVARDANYHARRP
jgi:hypothetical protein